MSDLMLHGILNAPCDCSDFVGVAQLKDASKRASVRISELEAQPTIADFLAQQKPMLDKTKSKMVSVASLEKFMRGEM